ncbi:MAG: hypothetical protein A2139_07980 [Desulfobacca sp. RBG_16_60_12]|nr:MAG: hypothetical protein A2139_07980 [Desulfobacca sp. RBG_16_60_12]
MVFPRVIFLPYHLSLGIVLIRPGQLVIFIEHLVDLSAPGGRNRLNPLGPECRCSKEQNKQRDD